VTSDGGTSSGESRGGSASANGGSTASGAGTNNDDAGGESAAGSAGEGPLAAVRFVLLEPPAPPSTPEGLTPDDQRNFSTRYCCASADASVIVGSSTYQFPRFVDAPSGELTRPFIWREETGLKALGPITDPQHGFVVSIDPQYLTADGSRVLGSYTLGEPGAGGSDPVWSTQLGGFFVWTEAQGYTRFGPPDPVVDGHIYGYGADGKTALGEVQPDQGSSLYFLWTESRGFSLLKDLPEWPTEGVPLTLSRDGSSILGLAGDSAFRWRESGLKWLGTVGIWPLCRAEAISGDGEVIAGMCQNGSQPPITFRWSEASGMVALDTNSNVQISPVQLSDHGDVLLGSECGAGGLLQACVSRGLAVWESGAGMRQVVPNADLQSRYLLATYGLTADGSAAIGTRLSNAGKSGDFQWTRSGGVRDLPSLDASDQTYALSQSKDGRLVAGSSGAHAVLWDAAGVRDLSAELRSAGVDQKGWDLSVARGVTAARSVITYGSASKSVPNSSTAEERVWIAWLPAR
jgi:probable HAF family extracellular repeat protein